MEGRSSSLTEEGLWRSLALMKVIGLMSGTSADGVDAALVDITGTGHNLKLDLITFRTFPYPPDFRARLLIAMTNRLVPDTCHLNAALGEWFARAALAVTRRAHLSPRDIAAIGSHGQTFHHLPIPRREASLGSIRSTLQLGSPAVIAERTGIDTVSDFRMRDMAAGGEGAPLTPYLHHLLFRDSRRTRAVVNIGGISNLTYLAANGSLRAVRAFDTGPGNMLIDGLVRRFSKGRDTFDREGRLAAKGTVHEGLLKKLLRHPYFQRRPPKSTGREEFGEGLLQEWLDKAQRPALSKADLLATFTAYTARSIADARRFLPREVNEVLICGGGAKNQTLMRMLREAWGSTPVRSVETLGWNPRALEAVAFAVFAYQTVHGVPCNLPSVTGAKRAVVLGVFVQGHGRVSKAVRG
jgi:anhydro-N-acetylmuramic acid kinase